MRLVLGLLCCLTASAATDSVTIYEADNQSRTTLPVTFGRPFARGEIANCPKPGGISDGSWQADVKTRWDDGSVKFAVISLILPSLSSGGSQTYAFANASCANTGYLTRTQMNGFNSNNWGAQLRVTANGVTVTRDAETMLGNTDPAANAFGDCKNDYWLQGPVVTAVIVQDCTSATAYDFGWKWDGSTMGLNSGAAYTGNSSYASLHPWFILYFYPGSNAVRTDIILENDWTSRAQNQAIQVAYYTGQTPTKVLGYDGAPRITTANDISWSKGSPTIVSAGGASFSSNDVGSSIALGADPPGIGSNTRIDTTICAVANSTHATLCAPMPHGTADGYEGAGKAAINVWYWGQMYRKTFWTGAGNPGNVLIDHNWAYLISSKMVPPYDTNVSASPDSSIYKAGNDYCNSSPSTGTDFKCMAQYSVTGVGYGPHSWSDMGDRGGTGRIDPGFSQADGDPTPMSREALLYLTNMNTCSTAGGLCAKAWLMLTGMAGARHSSLVSGSAYPSGNAWIGGSGTWNNAGNIPYHSRESRTAAGQYLCEDQAAGQYATVASGKGKEVAGNYSATCDSNSDSPFGRPLSRYYDPDSSWGRRAVPSGAEDPASRYGHWNPDPIRWLEWSYIAYLLTGDYYYSLDLQMNGAWAASVKNTTYADYGSNRFFAHVNPKGAIMRESAGLLDAIAKAWAVSVDGTLEQKYFDSVLASNAEVWEGMMDLRNGVNGISSSLTPASPNTNCGTYGITTANRWDWGRCTLMSLCGSGEPQGASCTPSTAGLHMPASGSTGIGLFTNNQDIYGFSVGYSVAGSTTRLVQWFDDSSKGISSLNTGDTIYCGGVTAGSGWTGLIGNTTVAAKGSTSSNCGPGSCSYVDVNVNTSGATGQPGTVACWWAGFGKITAASVASNSVLTGTTITGYSNGAEFGDIIIYGCVDQSGTNWSGLNGAWTPIRVSATTFTIGFNSTGFPPFSQSGCRYSQMGVKQDLVSDGIQGWQTNLFAVMVNNALRMGTTYFTNVANELRKRIVEQLNNGITDSRYNPYLVAKNIQPVRDASGARPIQGNATANPNFLTWADLFSAYPPSLQTLNSFRADNSAYDTGSAVCGDHGYGLIARALASFAYGTTSGSLKGDTGWNWINANLPYFNNGPANGDAGCGSSDEQIKFAFAPDSTTTTMSSPSHIRGAASLRGAISIR